MANEVQRKNRGRQKVVLKRMEKDSNRQVTFSKRRAGLFKKASELCTLCGAEAAIVVFSPGKKAFSFGHPCVETIIDRFLLTGGPAAMDEDNNALGPQQSLHVEDLNMELTLMNNRVEIERKRNEELSAMRKAREELFWWDVPVDRLRMEHLQHLKASLEELKKIVFHHGNKLMMDASTNAIPNPFMVNPVVGYQHNAVMFDPSLGFGPYQ